MWTHDLSAMARDEEPGLGPVPKTAFEKIEGGLKEALEIARGNAQPAQERPYPPPPYHLADSFRYFLSAFSPVVIGLDMAAEERPYLPIHRAMSRMLHTGGSYANRAFMPGGLLVADEPH